MYMNCVLGGGFFEFRNCFVFSLALKSAILLAKGVCVFFFLKYFSQTLSQEKILIEEERSAS